MNALVGELFQAPARTALLRLLLHEGVTGSMRQLSQQGGLSHQAVRKEVEHLERLGLVITKPQGAAMHVSANWDHPATSLLQALMALGDEPPPAGAAAAVREALSAYGAPLLEDHPTTHWSLEETLVRGVQAARHDGTILRILPVVLAKNRNRLEPSDLLGLARQYKVRPEMGMVLDLTGKLIGEPSFHELAKQLQDNRFRRWREFPVTQNRFEAELARRNAFESAHKWHFWTNMTEDSFRSLLSKHCPELVRV